MLRNVLIIISVITFFTRTEYLQDNEQILICLNKSDPKENIGRKVRVIGTYRIQSFYGKKNTLIRDWPAVRMNDSSELMIGFIWITKEAPDSLLVNPFIGKTVTVMGFLNGQPTGSIQNFSFTCISPVNGI